MILTVSDLKEPKAQDLRSNHKRSQDLLQLLLGHRGVRDFVQAPFASEDGDEADRERLAFTGLLFGRLRSRGIHGIRTFRVMLHNMDLEHDGTCMARTLEGALTHMGLRLKRWELEKLKELFGTGDGDMLNYAHLLAHGYSNWSLQRHEVVKEAYELLSEACPGTTLTLAAIESMFRPDALTASHVPELLEHHSAHEFLTQWSDMVLSADGLVAWVDFVEYYLDVSPCFDSEQEFCSFVCRSWGIDMDDCLAKKVFRRFASTDNDSSLPAADFIRMLDELDSSITEDEALAWFEAIDEDDNGEVSLEEFVQSKVLKVKRLFDQIETHSKRAADKEELKEILRALNPAITDEEALVIYHYADVNGNGVVSFQDFLENNLLKLLHVFEEFDRTRTRSFNEAELRKLLRKLDPFLDDFDIHQIFKAIDTDCDGTVSFSEFCTSHVLRAKTLFDRYDVDRSRTLTQFRFRELMLDMDDSLTTTQMEAIYNMVVDAQSYKVHLAGFLNPNIVKLKLLFDKFDMDRSRYLDSAELRAMLKQLFTGVSDKDLEALQSVLCPVGCEQGITFTMYIQRFKDVSRTHDLMQLAKRRQGRQKIQSRGLVA